MQPFTNIQSKNKNDASVTVLIFDKNLNIRAHSVQKIR